MGADLGCIPRSPYGPWSRRANPRTDGLLHQCKRLPSTVPGSQVSLFLGSYHFSLPKPPPVGVVLTDWWGAVGSTGEGSACGGAPESQCLWFQGRCSPSPWAAGH